MHVLALLLQRQEPARHTKEASQVLGAIRVSSALLLALVRVPQLVHLMVLGTLEAGNGVAR